MITGMDMGGVIMIMDMITGMDMDMDGAIMITKVATSFS